MSFLILIVVIFFLSLFLAICSLRDYQGHKEVKAINSALDKQRIRGGITFREGEKPIHHSSKSS